MATIFNHPDKDHDPSKFKIEVGDCKIAVEQLEGNVLTTANIIGMLELVKSIIVDSWLND